MKKQDYINIQVSPDSEEYFDLAKYTEDFRKEKFNQAKYIKEFKKETYKQYNLLINKTKYEEVIKKLDSVENKNAYIIGLIKKDVEK